MARVPSASGMVARAASSNQAHNLGGPCSSGAGSRAGAGAASSAAGSVVTASCGNHQAHCTTPARLAYAPVHRLEIPERSIRLADPAFPTAWISAPDPVVPGLAGALTHAAAAIARLDQALGSHPLRPAFLYRARLEAGAARLASMAKRSSLGSSPPCSRACACAWTCRCASSTAA